LWIAFAITGLAGRPARLIGRFDRGERIFRVIVAIDRIVVDLLLTLVPIAKLA